MGCLNPIFCEIFGTEATLTLSLRKGVAYKPKRSGRKRATLYKGPVAGSWQI